MQLGRWPRGLDRRQLAASRDPRIDPAVEDGDPTAGGVLRVALRLVPGLAHSEVQSLATRIAERLATDGEFRGRVDELTFALSPADAT